MAMTYECKYNIEAVVLCLKERIKKENFTDKTGSEKTSSDCRVSVDREQWNHDIQ